MENSTQIALMKEGEALAEKCGKYLDKLREHADTGRPGRADRLQPALDQRWISIGATDLQRGFMAITRGIAQPTNF